MNSKVVKGRFEFSIENLHKDWVWIKMHKKLTVIEENGQRKWVYEFFFVKNWEKKMNIWIMFFILVGSAFLASGIISSSIEVVVMALLVFWQTSQFLKTRSGILQFLQEHSLHERL